MSQTDHQILIETKPYFYACISTGILAAYSLLIGNFIPAFLAASLCILLSINLLKNKNSKKLEDGFSIFKYSSLALGLLGLIGLTLNTEYASTWLYFIPMLIFFFYDFKPALALIIGFSILVTVALNLFGNIFENIQALLNYFLYLSMAFSLVYLRELRRKQLKPLRRTDNLTKAATKEHLEQDLTKEIQRSEREGSELSLVALGVDKNCLSKLTPKEQDSAIILLGKLLHNNLRLFDSYYLWEANEFLIILPHTSSSQAIKIANALRIKIRKELHLEQEGITVSAGLSCLNIGDDSQSIIDRASEALKETQATSQNRTLAFRDSKAARALENLGSDQIEGENNAS